MDSFGQNLIEVLPRLRRYAISLSRSRERADDLVQTACAKALAARGSWQEDTRFDAWMFRILRNAWIDTLRQQQRGGPMSDIDDHPDAAATDGESAVMARLSLQSVNTAIDTLPVEQRDVLLLVCVEDFSYGQAAEMLGIPLGTVMSRLARAREKISLLTGIESKSKR